MVAAKNTVVLKDGVIIITQRGDQTYDSMNAITRQVKKLAADLTEVKLLVDYQSGGMDIGARKAGIKVGHTLKFDKMAFFGASPYIIGMVNLLARSLGKRDKIHFAKSMEEALEWLK